MCAIAASVSTVRDLAHHGGGGENLSPLRRDVSPERSRRLAVSRARVRRHSRSPFESRLHEAFALARAREGVWILDRAPDPAVPVWTGEDDDGVTGEIGARAMDERAALLSRAVADVEEHTHVGRGVGPIDEGARVGRGEWIGDRAQGADGVESVADGRTEVEDEDYGTGPSSPTIVSDDDAAVLDRDRGGAEHRRVSSLWALISVAAMAVATRGTGTVDCWVRSVQSFSAEPPSAVLTSQDSRRPRQNARNVRPVERSP